MPRLPAFMAHRTLDAPGGLAEELRFGVSHLRGVEQLLAFHLFQDEDALEHFGGCKEGRVGGETSPEGLALLTGTSADFPVLCFF